ncbi:uncharacterized protein LOC106770948 [Vigna radiata var. radiata]|uniref:Uncharacterized protein LOC106770948 n=1 Tax=Vigna radiata var. radiata TaxID=3916 RepID=A0A1S3V1S1_VIGRR|nr:uncharacterized protein LOC106770948 [Vigna radiata var. radiata]
MVGEAVNGRWFSGLLPVSRKSASDSKEVIGILAFEVAGLMSKVVSLWHSLSSREIMITKEWIVKSVGVKMLVSDDEDFLMELALSEILNNFESLAWSVVRLSKRCKDPVYHGYEYFLHNPLQHYVQWSGWEYAWKKMERKVKKMDRFVAAMSLLSQELEVLTEREQTFRRMKTNRQLHGVKLLEFHKRVMWQRQQVKTLRDMSPWNRSHDYVVRLLARSLFTILERIILVFGNRPIPIENQENESFSPSLNHLTRSHSFSSLMHSSKADSRRFSSQRFESKQGFVEEKTKNKRKKKRQQVLHSESKQFKNFGPFIGCTSVGNNSPVAQTCMPSNVKNIQNIVDKKSLTCRRRIYFKLYMKDRLKPGESTLGCSALALHYANVIVLIEKMVSAPHLIDHETRDDLYNMLPTTIRTALRSKLKWYAKSTRHSVDETSLAMEWSLVLSHILEWLVPLAHNMIKWHSERNFEREQSACKANILLVQTLYFANQAKAEAAMVELLVGLHYVCRINTKARMREAQESAGSGVFSSVRLRKNELYNK